MINPPTDNLYKFSAIVGLILIIFNSYYNLEMLNDLGNDIVKLNGEKDKHLIKLDIQLRKAKEMNELLKKAIASKKNFMERQEAKALAVEQKNLKKEYLKVIIEENNQEMERSREHSKKVESLHEKLAEEQDVLEFEKVELNTKNELIKRQEKRIEMYSKYMWAGVIFGLVLSIYGFRNWIRIQKAIDKELFKK